MSERRPQCDARVDDSFAILHKERSVKYTGQLGAQLGLKLDGPEKEDRRYVWERLAREDAYWRFGCSRAGPKCVDHSGHSSSLLTTGPSEIRETPRAFGYSLELVRAKRLAEGFLLMHNLKGGAIRCFVQPARQWFPIPRPIVQPVVPPHQSIPIGRKSMIARFQ